MFENAARASEALRLAAAEPSFRPLMPALSGCPDCGTAQTIAAPSLGICVGCGADVAVLDRTYGDGASAHHPPRPA